MKKYCLVVLGLSMFIKMSYAVNSWTTQYSSGYARDISFPDSLHGWAIELKMSGFEGGKVYNNILFTTDGGKIWNVKPTSTTSEPEHYMTKICFADSLVGLLGGWWRSFDTGSPYPGENWALVSTGNAFGTYNLKEGDASSHYQHGGIESIETATGKLFWSCVESGITGSNVYLNGRCIDWWTTIIGAICFIDTSYGWVCCNYKLFKTTKGIDSLSPLYSFSMNDIDFVDSLHGWAVGDTGTILYTDNGGTDSVWDTLTSGVTNNLKCVKFVDSLNGWAGGTGVILRTRDGGQTWVTEYSDTVSKICALDTIYAWALRGNGNILKYNPVIGEEEERLSVVSGQLSVKIIKDKIYLSVPNNEYTNMEHPALAVTLITIYDLCGREKEVVYNGTLSKGNYTFTPNIRTNGIYFVRLKTNNFTETKKITIIK
ncbi:MAG: YCF48-related protein [bacterium]|nr:YCF48-related protein [bacterium]